MSTFADLLRRARDRSGLSQAEAARRAGLGQRSWQNWERGRNVPGVDAQLDETALVLPSVVAGIVLIVQHSLALAFSLAGIVAGVQFRRALTDTFDTLFIFVAIGVGIAAGIKALDVGFVLAVFFCYATLIICLNSDGLESHHLFVRKQEKAAQKEQQARDAATSAAALTEERTTEGH